MEQVFALDPDVIALPTSSGYHPPEELYEAPYYAKLQSLRAVKQRKVIALPWMPCNCSKRLEYPIEVMMIAKISFPEAFEDIQIHEWVLSFYQTIYGVDRNKAKEIRSAQWLDWTIGQL
jgi:iron complex transport system substrate-binding protein